MPPGLGAASLLARNDDARWPAFERRDLETLCPGIRRVDLAEDGATTASVRNLQLRRIPGDLEPPLLITLTAGGNDLVGLLDLGFLDAEGPGGPLARRIVRNAADTLEEIVGELRIRFPDAALLVGTVYDPSDGTGDLGDGRVRERELEALDAFNRRVDETARAADAVTIPIHDHFLGHGLTVPDEDERWYWPHSIIEPSARGASEVRRLWLEALGA